jgi:hypothetical protein
LNQAPETHFEIAWERVRFALPWNCGAPELCLIRRKVHRSSLLPHEHRRTSGRTWRMEALQNADCSGLHQRIYRPPSVRSNRLSVERPTRCPSYPAVVSMESVLRHWPGRGGGDLLQLNAGNRRSSADRRSCFGNDSTMRSCPNAERWLRASAVRACNHPGFHRHRNGMRPESAMACWTADRPKHPGNRD